MYEAEGRKAKSQRATGGQHRIRIHVTPFCPCIHPRSGQVVLMRAFCGQGEKKINKMEAADSGLN